MTIQQAFLTGLELVRDAGMPLKGTDVCVLAAERFFREWAETKQHDPRFAAESALCAKWLIARAYTLEKKSQKSQHNPLDD